ncbi:MAG TPA: alpha/beta hydrolase family protein [Vicinamibacterales bacterium]|nr:alpha/beta hydrolase family protein [Vicinamibacterales bacterium]
MIARLFHAWERRLHAVSKDRVVRPFEWGLDWIETNGPPTGAPPEQIMLDWASRAVADSTRFFETPDTSDYTFWPDAHGATGALSFPSAFHTRYPENNTVHALYFEAKPRRAGSTKQDPAYESSVRRAGPALGTRHKRAVLVLPQWNAGPDGHVGLCRLLNQFGLSALRLTLPYHDARRPAELNRADYIVSANVGRTLQACRQAVMDARRAVTWLARQGYDRIGILGTSIGSCLSLLTAAHEPRIHAQALNHISPYFADVVWRGLSTTHVRAALDGAVALDQLRDMWLPISPQVYLERIRDKKTLLVYARYDLTFPVDLSRELVGEFQRRHIPHELAVLPCGHYSTGVTPFKYLDGFVLARFLNRNL